DEGFHEINLSGKQVIALFMIATTVVVFIFLCGVLVGRNLRDGDGAMTTFAASPADIESRTAQAQPVDPPPTPEETAEELTYHGRLQGENAEPPAPPPPDPPQPAVEEPPAVTPPAAAPTAAEPPPADV